MKTFNEIYTTPFTWEFSKVWTADDKMAFDFPLAGVHDDAYVYSPEEKDAILAVLNGNIESEPARDFTLEYDDGNIYAVQDGKKLLVMIIRGWGYLTGIGGLNLPPKDAAKIQDEFAQWIINTLTPNNNET